GMQPIDLLGEVGLIRAAAVVIGAAGADGEAQSHRLQGAGFVTGDLESFDMWGEVGGVAADVLGSTSRSFGEQIAEALTAADELQRVEEGVAVAESELRSVEVAALGAFHGEGDRRTGGDGVD